MHLPPIALILATALQSAAGPKQCGEKGVRYRPRVLTQAERDGFANSINEVCSKADSTDPIVYAKSTFGDTVFDFTRGPNPIGVSDCKMKFNSIINQCVTGESFEGGRIREAGHILQIWDGSDDPQPDPGDFVARK